MPVSERPIRRRRNNQVTHERLILATERLVARFGVEAVSMRQIGQEAGLANNSGVQYHFGTKESLIQAVIAYRQPQLDARRRELLDAAQVHGEPSSRDLLEILLRPLVELVDENGEHRYVQFIWQLQRPDQADESFHLPTLTERADELPRILSERLGDLSTPNVDRFIRSAVAMFLFLVMSRDRHPDQSDGISVEDNLQISVDMINAALAAGIQSVRARTGAAVERPPSR